MDTEGGGITLTHLDRKFLPFVLRAGLLLIHLASRPTGRRTLPLLLLHASELCLTSITYGIDEHILAYGQSTCQLIGLNYTRTSPQDKTITGWSAVVTATGLFGAMVNGRMHHVGFLTVVFIMAVFVDPVMINWIQPNDTIMRSYNIHDVFRSYRHMGGCAVIHISAGFVAFIALTFVGRRRISREDMKGSSQGLRSGLTSFLGYCLLIIGFIYLCLPNTSHIPRLASEEHKRVILTNNVLAIAGGILIVLIMRFSVEKATFKLYTLLRCVKGAIAGMVLISAGADVYAPSTAMVLGMMGGAFYYFVARKLFRSPWEEREYCNMIIVHLNCGLASTVIASIFDADSESTAVSEGAVWTVSRQVLYNTSFMASLFVIFASVCGVLHCFGCIRDDEQRDPSKAVPQVVGKNELPVRVAYESGDEDKSQDASLTLKELQKKQMAYLRHFLIQRWTIKQASKVDCKGSLVP